MKDIFISSVASISSLGHEAEEVKRNFLSGRSFIDLVDIGGNAVFAAVLSDQEEDLLRGVVERNELKDLDRTALMAIVAAHAAVERTLNFESQEAGVLIGSSRGATALFERYHAQFLAGERLPPFTSPVTTLGNISSAVAQDLMTDGFVMSHSVTCSTALHAIATACAWIRSGMAESFIAGGSEAPLTPFTIAQMRALRIYAEPQAPQFPCQPLGLNVPSGCGLVLGEGASVCTLESSDRNALARIVGIGFSIERIPSLTGISDEGQGIERAMRKALMDLPPETSIDAVIMHAPGTRKGDEAELSAIRRVFPEKLPLLTSNKWIIGHTFAAAGAFSLEYALYLLKEQRLSEPPYPIVVSRPSHAVFKNIMINAAGFGGNAVSLIISSQ